MVRKRVDERVRRFIEEGVALEQRSLVVLVGDYGKDQKELGFSTHRKKRMKAIKKQIARGLHDATDEPFELFISQTDIRWCYYRDTHKILGATYGTLLYAMSMDVHARFRGSATRGECVPRFNERFILSLADCRRCLVLDDELNVLPLSRKHVARFEDAPPDAPPPPSAAVRAEIEDLAATLANAPPAGELVAKARTLDQARAVLAFIDALAERRARSVTTLTAPRGRGKSAALGLCLAAAVATGYASVTAPSPENVGTVFEFLLVGLEALHYSEHGDYEVLKHRTDGGDDVPVRVNVYTKKDGGERTTRQVVQYVSPGDPEKLSHAELLVIDEAAALPLPTVKKLLGPYVVFLASTVTGYEGTGRALQLKLIAQLRAQHARRAVTEAAADAADGVRGVAHAKKGDLKLHEARWAEASAAAKGASDAGGAKSLRELALEAPIRYAAGDDVEAWLHRALCLDSPKRGCFALSRGLPAPAACGLYEVDRDALFSYHALSERFLQRVMALYTAAHYKNQPNDLQLLSDAPAHRLYVLLGPVDEAAPPGTLPDVLVVVQVALEGLIAADVVRGALARGERAAGDLVPWTLSQQFCDPSFAKLSGARVVRVATHPDAQRMGYGAKALADLVKYFEGDLDEGMEDDDDDEDEDEAAAAEDDDAPDDDASDDDRGEIARMKSLRKEELKPRSKLPPLLAPVGAKAAPALQWVGASFGLTEGLFEFWGKLGMRPCYVRQTANDVTGEHTAIVLREIRSAAGVQAGWSDAFVDDFRRRVGALLGAPCFHAFPLSLSLGLLGARDASSVLNARVFGGDGGGRSLPPAAGAAELGYAFTAHDLDRLDLYAKNMVDHHLISDLLPRLGELCFAGKLAGVKLSLLQAAIVLGLSLQRKDVADVASELNLPVSQALALYNKAVRKFSAAIRGVREAHVRDVELGLGKQDAAPRRPSSRPWPRCSTTSSATRTTRRRRRRPRGPGRRSSTPSRTRATTSPSTTRRRPRAADGGLRDGALVQVPSTKAPRARGGDEPAASPKKAKKQKRDGGGGKKKKMRGA
ncbi:pyruvate carboxylase [Aureococcus anophagefferens]|nr:pyruvate carboxylase [Aureococcus anophagefferens]